MLVLHVVARVRMHLNLAIPVLFNTTVHTDMVKSRPELRMKKVIKSPSGEIYFESAGPWGENLTPTPP